MAKTISFGLSVREVRNAKKQLEEYKEEFMLRVNEFTEELVLRGVEIAELNITGFDAVFSSELLNSINFEAGNVITDGASWIIYTDCEWAKYVEFGTGVVGSENPHPDTSIGNWKYDTNNHGEAGWNYYKDGEWHYTKGMPSRPFMYQTGIELAEIVTEVAREVFSSD